MGLLIGFLLATSIGVGARAGTAPREEPELEVEIHWIVPGLHKFHFEYADIIVRSCDAEFMAKLKGIRRDGQFCQAYITLRNRGGNSYLLSGNDVNIMLRGTRFTDSNGKRWSIKSRILGQGDLFDVPAMAESERAMLISIGRSELEPVDQPAAAGAFPDWFDYEVPKWRVTGRPLLGRELAQGVELQVAPSSGRCVVAPDGYMPPK